MKNLIKLLISIILISSYWWSFSILEYFGKTGQVEYQILLALPFMIFSVVAAIIGAVLLIKTIAKIFKLQDKKVL